MLIIRNLYAYNCCDYNIETNECDIAPPETIPDSTIVPTSTPFEIFTSLPTTIPTTTQTTILTTIQLVFKLQFKMKYQLPFLMAHQFQI